MSVGRVVPGVVAAWLEMPWVYASDCRKSWTACERYFDDLACIYYLSRAEIPSVCASIKQDFSVGQQSFWFFGIILLGSFSICIVDFTSGT